MLNFRSSIISMGLLSLFISFGAQADTTATTTVVEKRILITPPPKGVCTTVEGHWEGNTWIEAYTVCKYENRKEGVAWIGDYWSCIEATTDGTCTNWQLVAGHWVSTLE